MLGGTGPDLECNIYAEEDWATKPTIRRVRLSSSKAERTNGASVLSCDVAGFRIFAIELKR